MSKSQSPTEPGQIGPDQQQNPQGQQPPLTYPPQQGTEYSQYPLQQQWQQPPQGYPPTQYQPPMMQPPQRRKRRTGLWITLGIVAFLVIVGAIASGRGGSSPTSSRVVTNAPAATGNTPSSAPTQAPSTNTIGKPVVVNSEWMVTLNKVSTSPGTDFDMPKSGNIFLVVNVTLLNTSGSTQNASSLVQWSLKDSTGQTYTEDISFGGEPGGTVANGGLIRGNIAYEVPKSVHNFTLQFVPDIGGTDLAEWTVSI